MTPQEQEMIDGLISRIRGTQVQNKDTAAEQRIQQGLAGYPDSLYVLAQTVLVQQYGLKQAQTQIDDLKQQNAALQEGAQHAAEQAKSSGGSFLSHIFGGGSSQAAPSPQSQQPQQPPYGNVNVGSPQPPYAGQGYPPPAPYPPAGYSAPGVYPVSGGGGLFSGGGGGFFQGALRTAAGVAAGEVAFQGIEDLFHGFGGGGGRGFGGEGFGGGGGGETVVNNYYDDDRGAGDRGGDGRQDAGSFYNPSDDASRDSGDASQFADTGDSSGFDDSSSFDDGGSDDNSGNF